MDEQNKIYSTVNVIFCITLVFIIAMELLMMISNIPIDPTDDWRYHLNTIVMAGMFIEQLSKKYNNGENGNVGKNV